MKEKNSGGQGKFQKKDTGPRVNEQIRIPECRLIGDDGTAYGVVSMDEARRIADESGVDLIEVSPTAKPPVVKVMDFGKYKYEIQKKAQEAKKKQTQAQLKEIQFKPNIETHDLMTKLKHCERFLAQGDKVKMVMQFRGREMAYKDAGMEKFKSILETVTAMGSTVEAEPKFMGNRIITIVSPEKTTAKKK